MAMSYNWVDTWANDNEGIYISLTLCENIPNITVSKNCQVLNKQRGKIQSQESDYIRSYYISNFGGKKKKEW